MCAKINSFTLLRGTIIGNATGGNGIESSIFRHFVSIIPHLCGIMETKQR